MANNPLPVGHDYPWYVDPDFVAARKTTIPPNGRTTYVRPRPTGATPTDVTSFHYGQRYWSKRHMPNILYRLNRSRDWLHFKPSALPAQKRDIQGNLEYEHFSEPDATPRPLLDFRVLPDQIGSQEHWFIMEAWRRLDPRIRWIDIHMRIEHTSTKPTLDVLRSRISRLRATYFLQSWWLSPSAANNARVLDALTPMQRRLNTTRGATPGLVDRADIDGERILHPGEENEAIEAVSDEESAGTVTDASNAELAEDSGAGSDSLGHQDHSDGFSDLDGVEESDQAAAQIPGVGRRMRNGGPRRERNVSQTTASETSRIPRRAREHVDRRWRPY